MNKMCESSLSYVLLTTVKQLKLWLHLNHVKDDTHDDFLLPFGSNVIKIIYWNVYLCKSVMKHFYGLITQ